jgi:phenylalanyl-tRNA synthetase alpha chain
MKEKIHNILTDFSKKLSEIKNLQELEDTKRDFLGKKGIISGLFQELKKSTSEQRATLGGQINLLRNEITEKLESQLAKLEKIQLATQAQKEWIDISLDIKEDTGSLHPLSILQYELEDIFTAMGFCVLDGNHIETEFYNFEALNIPKHHPSRDLQDTYYFSKKHLLRTQTSPLQIRAMESQKPPIRIIAPGKVFRAETRDASHENCFHQLEGMLIDKGISVAHLIYFMKIMLSKVFKKEVKVRLRPGYFPFVEPGFELDMSCQICAQKGCKMCKRTGWVEMIGCGMVHPKVLQTGGIDSKLYSGFAFGLGLDRLCIMRHKIDDIRHFHSANIKFIKQFA